MLSPHVVNAQLEVHCEFPVGPASHCSFPDQTIVSPQTALMHAFVHASVLFVFASSHVSPADACITPSPHVSAATHTLNPSHCELHVCVPEYPLIVQDCELESHCSNPALI